MERARLKMTYTRMGHNYTGSIWIQIYPTRGYIQKELFENIPFAQMMTRLARHARAYECDGINLSRLEVENSNYEMSETEIRQLREDPAAAIRSMCVPDRTIIVRDNNIKDFIIHMPPGKEVINTVGLKRLQLRTGHDTLADAFGDVIYCRRVKDGRIECPFCGRWSEVQQYETTATQQTLLRCPNCDTTYQGIKEMVGGWCTIYTQLLLACNKDRYYLPRPWNKSGPWISHEDLEQLYKSFVKERDDVRLETSRGDDPS